LLWRQAVRHEADRRPLLREGRMRAP
jgi:hypothetical protein